jgi:hypothetical protein
MQIGWQSEQISAVGLSFLLVKSLDLLTKKIRQNDISSVIPVLRCAKTHLHGQIGMGA